MAIYLRMRFLVLLCSCVCLSCGPQKPVSQDNVKSPTAVDTSQFYPLEPFFEQEVAHVDLRALDLQAHWKRGSHVVHQTLNKEQWADSVGFVKAVLNQYWFGHKNQFRESSFEDLGTERTVFDYTALDSAYALKQVTIQTDNRSQQIKSLYLVVEEKNAFVGRILHRLRWQAQSSLQWVKWHQDQPDSLSESLELRWKKTLQP